MKALMMVITAALAVTTGCGSMPRYEGDGQISNTTYWADGLVRTPRYTIKLASFGLDENIQQEFNLGDVAFFKTTRLTISVHFLDDDNWWHFSKLQPSETTDKAVAKHRRRDLDKVAGRLGYRVSTAQGDELFQSDKRFGDYVWSGMGSKIETYDPANGRTVIRKGSQLKLWFSYSGDPNLTNRADLVVVCEAR